jgi:hypothetical protein
MTAATALEPGRDPWGRVLTPIPSKTERERQATRPMRKTSRSHYKQGCYSGKHVQLSSHIIGDRRRSDR